MSDAYAKKIIDTPHHAICVVGAPIGFLEALRLSAIERGFGPEEIFVIVEPKFGVDDAHALSHTASFVSGGIGKIFLVEATMTFEAQNALLKIFEDPRGSSRFVLLVSSAEELLPTLRSRMQFINIDQPISLDGKKFLAMTPKDRLDYVAHFFEEKNFSSVQKFLMSLEYELAKKNNHQALPIIWKSGEYLRRKGASWKAILEYLACSL